MVTEKSSTGRESDKFMLRLPDGMRDTLKEQAKTNNRTLNAEIVARLEASLSTEVKNLPALASDPPLGSEAFAELLARKIAKVMPSPDFLAYEQFQKQMEQMAFEKFRDQWKLEFGFDPGADPIARESNKGPERSKNTKRPLK